ncbi:hypothetical protein GLOIN_2v1791978 [Rhizophagus clarus]|uniref:Uncharacterized protein n=1 Tax=Rhizophagus clarus TaxID=94130 RepID=A0A8H3QFH9_9GLOM|nr:hypothetical protein GLOIN_2v1791978 [Rhizophagus clarus]
MIHNPTSGAILERNGWTKVDEAELISKKLVENKNGCGNLDYGIELCTTRRIISLIEVKKDDFKQGFMQATVQMESLLGCKHKADEIDDEYVKGSHHLSCQSPIYCVQRCGYSKDIGYERNGGGRSWPYYIVIGGGTKAYEIFTRGRRISREIKRVRSGELPKLTGLEGKMN